jgi:hypothetical protein
VEERFLAGLRLELRRNVREDSRFKFGLDIWGCRSLQKLNSCCISGHVVQELALMPQGMAK